MVDFYANKRVVVTGGTGLVGHFLAKLLHERGANVSVVSLDEPFEGYKNIKFVRTDLREFSSCIQICQGADIVFHLAGVKAASEMSVVRPASSFVPMLTFNTNMMEAARRCSVERYLYTSSIDVYSQAAIMHEDDVWKTFPSSHRRFSGWAKRMGELQAEAYNVEYGWKQISIVRPAKVYGEFDNFDPKNATLIASLIYRAMHGENPLAISADSSTVYDFIHAEDVARGMLMVVEQGVNEPVNLGSGIGATMQEIVDTIANNIPGEAIKIIWATDKNINGNKYLLDTERAKKLGFTPKISIVEGIKRTIDWYTANRALLKQRYNAFSERGQMPHKNLFDET